MDHELQMHQTNETTYEKELHFPRDRQLRAEGDTNKGTRYSHKLVGNSPEMCRGLDSFGFADLGRQKSFCISLTAGYDDKDPRKFKM